MRRSARFAAASMGRDHRNRRLPSAYPKRGVRALRFGPPGKGKAQAKTRRSAEYAYEAGQGKRKPRRRPRVSRAVSKALKREPRSTASRAALSKQTRRAASQRSASARSAAARKAARTKGSAGRSAAAKKASRTRARYPPLTCARQKLLLQLGLAPSVHLCR